MKPINEQNCRELLATAKVGHLGCLDESQPYVVPINYVYEGAVIYSHSQPGRKIDALRKHPRTCLQVDEIRDEMNWRSVIAFGEYEEIQLPQERRQVLRKLIDRFPLLTPVESAIAADGAAPDSVVFMIRITEVTGISEGHGPWGQDVMAF